MSLSRTCTADGAARAESSASVPITVVSFTIQFLGHSKSRDNEVLAEVVGPGDIVVVQELVAPPFPGASPDGTEYKPDEEAAAVFDAMTARGFVFALLPDDTGTISTIHKNNTSTEWFVAFLMPTIVQVVNDLPKRFLWADRSHNSNLERVPHAFSFRSAMS